MPFRKKYLFKRKKYRRLKRYYNNPIGVQRPVSSKKTNNATVKLVKTFGISTTDSGNILFDGLSSVHLGHLLSEAQDFNDYKNCYERIWCFKFSVRWLPNSFHGVMGTTIPFSFPNFICYIDNSPSSTTWEHAAGMAKKVFFSQTRPSFAMFKSTNYFPVPQDMKTIQSDPSRMGYFHIWPSAPAPSPNKEISRFAVVVLTFYCKLYERN